MLLHIPNDSSRRNKHIGTIFTYRTSFWQKLLSKTPKYALQKPVLVPPMRLQLYQISGMRKEERRIYMTSPLTGIGLTRATLALQIFHHLLGRDLSRLLLVIEKNGKSVRKLIKNGYETISVKFSLRSKLWLPGVKNPHI